jgi:proteasome assembly chaperone (PAC2) family protein
VPILELEEHGSLREPVLVAAFDGWVDAGSAATAAAEALATDASVIGTFDADSIFDYRARRPTLDVVDGALLELDWPHLEIRVAKLDERDLVILSGPEPDYRWHELADEVTAAVRRLGVTSWVSLGAIPAAVPHTRPVPILGTSSVRGLLPEGIQQGPVGRLRVPAAVVSVLEHAVVRAGVPAIGLFAQIPHYISAGYPNASIELLRGLGAYLGVELSLGELPTRALETRTLLDAATSSDERTRAYVERLETLADEARLPAGDDLIADIERFLRERGGGDGGDSGTRLN